MKVVRNNVKTNKKGISNYNMLKLTHFITKRDGSSNQKINDYYTHKGISSNSTAANNSSTGLVTQNIAGNNNNLYEFKTNNYQLAKNAVRQVIINNAKIKEKEYDNKINPIIKLNRTFEKPKFLNENTRPRINLVRQVSSTINGNNFKLLSRSIYKFNAFESHKTRNLNPAAIKSDVLCSESSFKGNMNLKENSIKQEGDQVSTKKRILQEYCKALAEEYKKCEENPIIKTPDVEFSDYSDDCETVIEHNCENDYSLIYNSLNKIMK